MPNKPDPYELLKYVFDNEEAFVAFCYDYSSDIYSSFRALATYDSPIEAWPRLYAHQSKMSAFVALIQEKRPQKFKEFQAQKKSISKVNGSHKPNTPVIEEPANDVRLANNLVIHPLRFLVIEDDERWQEELSKILTRLAGQVQVDIAPTYTDASRLIKINNYDLATVDMSLDGDDHSQSQSFAGQGMTLLNEIRNSDRNNWCGLIMVTAYPEPENSRQAFRDYEVDDFIDKNTFDSNQFLESVRSAIWEGRIRRVERKAKSLHRLMITFDNGGLRSNELLGPNLRTAYPVIQQRFIDTLGLARQSKALDLSNQSEVQDIGQAVYQALTREQHILGALTTAWGRVEDADDFWLHFSAPVAELDTPLELIRAENHYLAHRHIITRSVTKLGQNTSLKTEPFHKHLEDLHRNKDVLRILIIDTIEASLQGTVEQEGHFLTKCLKTYLDCLDIMYEITLLTGPEATHVEVSQALRDGQYHLFHYKGDLNYQDSPSGMNGLMLYDRKMTADDLSLLVRGTDLRHIFLSTRQGDASLSYSEPNLALDLCQALTQADIPLVLGYRWVMTDEAALKFAQNYYQALWRTFSPGNAILQAREQLALYRDVFGEAWAAPLLLMQNI